MKIGTWIEALQALNPDFEVVLSADSEGNGFGKLTGLGGLVAPPKANCVHNDSMHASQMHLWCRRCGALRGPNGWALPFGVP